MAENTIENHNSICNFIDIDTGTFNPQRVVADLRELASCTGGPEGSRRLCWTPEWVNARNLLREELSSLPVDVDVDDDAVKEVASFGDDDEDDEDCRDPFATPLC